jgi:hypothetical protein
MIKNGQDAPCRVPEIQVMPGSQTGEKKRLAKNNVNLEINEVSDCSHLWNIKQ